MTGGKVVILGSTGRNIGAGMTGGIAFIIDEKNDLSKKVNKEIVSIHKITSSKQEDILLEIIREYRAKTNSLKAAKIIENWSYYKSTFKLIVPPSEEEMLGIKKIPHGSPTGAVEGNHVQASTLGLAAASVTQVLL